MESTLSIGRLALGLTRVLIREANFAAMALEACGGCRECEEIVWLCAGEM